MIHRAIISFRQRKEKKRKEEEGTKKNEHDVIVGNPDLSPKRETREEDLGLFVRGGRRDEGATSGLPFISRATG